MEFEELKKRIEDEEYLIKSHAIGHALKEGFDRRNIVEAICNGKIIEKYESEQRVLICGATKLAGKTAIYLHIVCEYSDNIYIEIVTAYIPDEEFWEKPPFKRR
jgi:Domain of unknown function (DUF4258)